MINVILIAPPAAGKGTQAELLEEKYKIPHISTGDLLRNEQNKNSKYAKEIKTAIDKGLFVDDKIVIDLLINRIKSPDCNYGYILDGFPRNIKQAKLYSNFLEQNKDIIEIVILINLDKETAKLRINNRLSCSNCGRVYNLMVDELKPIKDNTCDNCGQMLNKRNDDKNETYDIRYNEYILDTEPIINYYKEKGILYKVDGNKEIKYISQQIEDIIDKKAGNICEKEHKKC